MSAKAAIAAGLLGVLAPGAGHLYLGHALRALVPVAIVITLTLLLGLMGALSSLWGFTAYMAAILAMVLFSVLDSIRIGLKIGRTSGKWFGRWYVIVAWLILLAVLAEVWIASRSGVLGYAVFRVPGMSMSPALVAGDVVLVDTRPTIESLPLRSLVVVQHPDTGAQFIRRVVDISTANALTLRADMPVSPEADSVFRSVAPSSIGGHVTYVLWSPLRKQLGRAAQ
jgi:hypothetical protein